MNGRIGGRIGTSSPPSGYGANGLWRLGDVYAAIRGSFGGGGEYGGGGWPSVAFTISWPSAGWPTYGELNYADATVDGTATFDARVTSSPSDLSFEYFWEKSTDSGSTWSTVPGSSGSGATSSYDYYGTSVTLALTGQTISNDGTLYRLVVKSGLKQVRGASGTLRYDTISASWSYQPESQFKSVGQSVSFYAAGSITGVSYGGTYSISGKQWQRSTDGGTTWASFGGTDWSTQSFIVASGDNNSRYRLSLTFGSQTFYSNAALLVVS